MTARALALPGRPQALKAEASSCRACGATGLQGLLDYGLMPASDGFLSRDDLARSEPCYPLELALCLGCGLVQILETVAPETLFGAGYLYCSSVSASWLEQARANAEALIDRCQLGPQSRVVEIASNDGYLLQFFEAAGVPVLGIDPAPIPVAAAQRKGIPTLQRFFGSALARELVAGGLRADVLIANNVLAHVADIHDVLSGARELLAPAGILVIEVPYLLDLVAGCAFDTVYHEHLCYFSLQSLQVLLSTHGLYVNDLEFLPSHGGSLRLYVSPETGCTAMVTSCLDREREAGVRQVDYYRAFARRALRRVAELGALLDELACSGKTIAAYGAAAKGTILLNTLGPPAAHIAFVADRNPAKQGRWLPGVRLPIVGVEAIARQQPDYLLLLPWNIAPEIEQQQAAYLARGGRIIVPLPDLRIIEGVSA